MTNQPNLLVRLYRLTHQKYVTLTARLERNVRSGRFQSFRKSRRSSILHKIEKLKRKLQQLSLQLKLGAAAGAVAFFLNTGEVKAQLGPFVQQDRSGNPVRPPLVDMFQLPTAADVDGDGDIDVLVGLSTGYLRYYKNVGTPERPAFNEAFGADNPFDAIDDAEYDASPALGDIDGDGDPDLVLAEGPGDAMFYYKNEDGVFMEQTGTNNPFEGFNGHFDDPKLTAVDVDMDGDIDIVVGMEYDVADNVDYVVMLENDGNGNFTRNDFFDGLTNPDLKFPALADVDDDGDLDLFRGEDYYGFTNIEFYRQDPGGSFTNEFGSWDGELGNPLEGFGFASYGAPLFVDLDNDSDLDAIVGRNYKYGSFSSEYENSLAYLENTGDFFFEEKSELENPFDGIVSQTPEDNQGDARPAFLDVDNDGDLDMLLGSKYEQRIIYYEFDQNKETFIQKPEPVPFNGFPFGNAIIIRTHDYNNDGFLDLFTWDANSYMEYFENNQDGTFTQDGANPVAALSLTNQVSVALLDVDGDTDEDLFVGIGYNPGFRFYRNNAGTFVNETTGAPSPFNDPTTLGNVKATLSAEDFNSDGIKDLISGSQVTGEVRVFLNFNNNSFGELTDVNYPFPDINTNIDTAPVLVDYDEDGDQDLFVGDEKGLISFLENQNPAPVVDVQAVTEPIPDQPVVVFPNLNITDADDDFIVRAVVSINSFSPGDEEIAVETLPAGIESDYDASTGVLTITGDLNSTMDEFEMALRQITYENEANAFPEGRSINKTISIRVFDEDGTIPLAATANLTHANDLPVVNASVTSLSYTGSPLTLDNGIMVEDDDDARIASAEITIVNFISSEDQLSISGTLPPGIAAVYDPASGMLRLTGNATKARYQTALRMIQYENTNASGTPTPTPRSIEVRIHDGESFSAAETFTVNFAGNTAPSLLSGTTSVNYSGSVITVNNDITISDAENADLVSATVTISSGFVVGEDVLTVANASGLMPSYNSSNGTLTLNGPGTLAEFEAALESITYNNTSGVNGSMAPRTISIVVNDGAADSNIITVTVNYSVNEPVLATTITAVNYHLAQQPINEAITVDDPDSPELVSATITITGNWQPTEDLLAFNAGNGITGTFTSGTLSLTGAASLADYQTALRSVTYENIFEVSGNRLTRTVEIVVNDGASNSNVISTTINYVNESPVVTNTEDPAPYMAGVVTIADQITLADSDDALLQGATVSITQGFQSGEDQLVFEDQGAITGTFDAPGGVLTLSGSASVAEYQAALRSVQYRNDNDGDRSKANRIFTFTVTDGVDISAPVDVTLTLPNQIPTISITGNPPLYGSGSVTLAPSLTLADADNITIQSASVSISAGLVPSEDQLLFTNQNGISGNYTSSTGTLQLTGGASLADYQTALLSIQYANLSDAPTATPRTISYTVNDGLNESISALLTLNINEAPAVEDESSGALTNNSVSIGLAPLMTDPNNNLDLSTAEIVVQPESGVTADIVDGQLILNFTNVDNHPGIVRLTIRVCDALARCTEQEIAITIRVQVKVYNALSPNSDTKNDYFRIQFIRQNSRVSIYNRWGDRVYEQFDYDNDDSGKRFEGFNNNGTSLPSGTYFYKIELPDNDDGPLLLTGYLTLKH